MTNGRGEGICSVSRLRQGIQMQKGAYHLLHLRFPSPPITYHGLLDLQGRILDQGQGRIGDRQQCHPAGMTENQCRLGILGEEHPLHCHSLGLPRMQGF
jgi:hypothetical protein